MRPSGSKRYTRALIGYLLFFGCAANLAGGIHFEIRPVESRTLPMVVDSNSPSFWRNGQLRIFSSGGIPMVHTFDQELNLIRTDEVRLDRFDHLPMWIESVWEDAGGTLYAWYHHELLNVCPNSTLAVPEIGALVSYDGGDSFIDLGIVLDSGEPINCDAQNGFFASGHGDFTVILDRDRQFFYFYFGAYGGNASSQGIAAARMSFADRSNPAGAVWKYFEGAWSEPGLGGRVTPIFPASVGWQEANTDSLWGPSIHWNTLLQLYVVLLNRSCCQTGWPQEGIYLTVNADLSDPAAWTQPVKILEPGDWYPWVLGLGEGETSSEAGSTVRLFVRNGSGWEIFFYLEPDVEQPETGDLAQYD